MSIYRSIFILCFSLTVTSCERLIWDIPNDNPTAIFEETWAFVDREYAAFELRQVDWDELYTIYRPQINDQMTDTELFAVLSNLIDELEDSHSNICHQDSCANWAWQAGFPINYDADLLQQNYLANSETFLRRFTVQRLNEVGYIHLSQFSFNYDAETIRTILTEFSDTKGLIFDIRNNRGGSLRNMEKIAGIFTTETVYVGRQRYRKGVERNNFSAWEELFLSPNSDLISFTKPVVVLTNRAGFSAASLFAQYEFYVKSK